uniref:Uncharacterized protein n=1 Tax=Panagrolaimus sp. ES5 TaxID=591445 RepID=A0AC34GCE4_9BILA
MSVKNLINSTVEEIRDICVNDSFDEFSTCMTEFYSNCPAESLRYATLELIVNSHKHLTLYKGIDYKRAIDRISTRFDKVLKDKDAKFLKNLYSKRIPDVTWEYAWKRCFEAVSHKKVSSFSSSFDKLFQTREPETDKREALINNSARKLLGDEDTYGNGIGWIRSFDLETLKEEQFQNILYNSFIFEKGRVFVSHLFTSQEDKLRCLKILDDCFARAVTEKV